MANNLYSPGSQIIFSSTATGAGAWFRLHPNLRNVTFQALQTGTSVGTSVTSSGFIEASNDGVNALATHPITIGLAGASPQSDGATLDAHWEYVRFNLNTISTGTVSCIASGNFND